MAIWQFECKIIPLRENIAKLSYDKMISWQEYPLPYDVDFLERERSWSAEIIQYGRIDETCIEFIYANDMLKEIECRLDLRTLTKHGLIQIIEYVKNIGACFLVKDSVCLPEIETMIDIMKQSEANQYCKNPLEYIKTLTVLK